ncbi:threonine/homoserine/homoserine lactone efflux protein [Bradyrhizobium sp. AZCC 1678]|uniref:LysE family translocator n=1 Tax=Bradyrhizobium sp. AZCC 1678 TaxID=3117030 RepID=UPI002FF40FF3
MRQELLTIGTALALYAAVVVSPGPNFALISRLAAAGARRAAFGATFGLAIAATVYAVLTMTGLALVLMRVGWLANLMQFAGGCYLVYLGIMVGCPQGPSQQRNNLPPHGVLRGLRMGVLVNLSNPKGIAFFIGLYALAIPPATALWAKLVILAGGFLLEAIWYSLVTVLFSSRPFRAVYDRFGFWVERVIGTALAVFGLRLIAEKL